MATPTFDSVSLTSNTEKTIWPAPATHFALDHLPGTDGAFVSEYGSGGRMIPGTGFLEASGASSAAANVALKAAIRTVQAKVMASSATFVDTDGVSYTGCWLVRYDQVGPVSHQVAEATYTARCRVAFQILDPSP